MTLCQCSEIVVMIVMPWFIGRIGLKNVLVVGMAAWAIRYVPLCHPELSLDYPGPVGCTASATASCSWPRSSTSARRPRRKSAPAHSLVALLMWGAGMLVGTLAGGLTGDQYPPPVTIEVAKGEVVSPSQILPPWVAKETVDGVETQVGIAPAIGRADANDVTIERARKNLPAEGLTMGGITYAKADLLSALENADMDESGAVTRAEWQAARSHNWPPIWFWPGALAAVVCLIFIAGGSDASRPVEATATPG